MAARKQRKRRHDRIVVDTTPKMVRYLDELVETGLYGSTRSEVATRLVTRGLEAVIEHGVVERIG